ncbi:MAG: hypothetical protein LBR79_07060 [Oscillospiraceae bacterium]|nr:hypothetical protein [Oscillospiraceae bacterium]
MKINMICLVCFFGLYTKFEAVSIMFPPRHRRGEKILSINLDYYQNLRQSR